jgi:poly(A) polymerase
MTNFTTALSIVEKLQSLRYTAYFAGGWVRDYLLSFPSDDIDIATNASIEVMHTLFAKTIPVGAQFGILIVVEDGHQFEIATFRKESDYLDGRRPSSVEACSPEEDAKRRDFTINGLFYDPIKKKIYDYVGGQEDLKNGLIRAIGNPVERFQEDRLRMLRAIRYSTRFGFQIDPATEKAIELERNFLFPAVSMERVYQELMKMDLYDTLASSLRLLYQFKLLTIIFDELIPIEKDKILKHIALIDELPKKTPLIAKLSILFDGESLETKLKALKKLKISRKEVHLIEYLDHLGKTLTQEHLDDYDLAYLYAHEFFPLSISIFKQLKGYKKEAIHYEKHALSLKSFVERIQSKNPVITSHDLMQEGIPSGKVMGEILKEAEKISIRNKLLDKTSVMKKLRVSTLWPFKSH